MRRCAPWLSTTAAEVTQSEVECLDWRVPSAGMASHSPAVPTHVMANHTLRRLPNHRHQAALPVLARNWKHLLSMPTLNGPRWSACSRSTHSAVGPPVMRKMGWVCRSGDRVGSEWMTVSVDPAGGVMVPSGPSANTHSPCPPLLPTHRTFPA